MSNELICPKCGSEMRSYERNEVVVDQCTGCGGLFLDKGELERLATAESTYYGNQQAPQAAAPMPTPAAPQPAGGGDQRERYDDRREHRDDRKDYRDPKKKKKRSFLEDFLEF